jgi:hypothetical protein
MSPQNKLQLKQNNYIYFIIDKQTFKVKNVIVLYNNGIKITKYPKSKIQ